MPAPILSPRSRVPAAKADRLLKCYAERLLPAEAARRTGLSLNMVYEQYGRLRWRLIEVGYYRDAAHSIDEPGLAEETKQALRQRRGLEADDIYAHAAEIIEWLEEWPSGEVLRHLRKIIALTGPIDGPLDLTEPQARIVTAYVRYAPTKLIHDRAKVSAEKDEALIPFADRASAALGREWCAYRSSTRHAKRLRQSPT